MERNNPKEYTYSYFANNQTQRVQNEFLRFLSQMADDPDVDQSMFEIWNHTEDLRFEAYEESLKALSLLRTRLYSQNKTVHSNRWSGLGRMGMKYAAVVVLFVVIGLMSWFYVRNQNAITFSTGHLGATNLVLPDGTEVRLEDNSSIMYPIAFGKEKRVVQLKGSANFSVSKNKECPFVVKTTQLEIRAVGTKFDVKMDTHDKTIMLLEEGIVEVTTPYESVFLTPGLQATYEPYAAEMDIVSVDVDCGISENILSFEGMTLSDILDEVSILFDTTFIVRGVLDKQRRYTIQFKKNDTLAQILETLRIITDEFYYEKINDTHVIITMLNTKTSSKNAQPKKEKLHSDRSK